MSVNPISLSSREMVGALPRPAAEHPEISHLVLTFPSDGSQIDLAYFVSSLQARDRHPPPSFPGLSGGFLAFRGCLRGRPERCEMWLLGHVPPRSGGTRSASDAGGHPCHNPQPWPVPVPPASSLGLLRVPPSFGRWDMQVGPDLVPIRRSSTNRRSTVPRCRCLRGGYCRGVRPGSRRRPG